MHAQWQAARGAARRGRARELAVAPVTALAAERAAARPAEVGSRRWVRARLRPDGRRFGALVHAVLAEVDLARSAEVARVAAHQGRIVGASAEEVAAAATPWSRRSRIP